MELVLVGFAGAAYQTTFWTHFVLFQWSLSTPLLVVDLALATLFHEINWSLLIQSKVMRHIEHYNARGHWACGVWTQRYIGALRIWQTVSHNLVDFWFPSWCIVYDPSVGRTFFTASQGFWTLLRADNVFTYSFQQRCEAKVRWLYSIGKTVSAPLFQ